MMNGKTKQHPLCVTIRRTFFTLLLAAPIAASANDLLNAYNDALKNDPQLKAAASNRDALGEVKPQSLALLLPNANISAVTTDTNSDTRNSSFFPAVQDAFNSHSYRINITQPVYHHDFWVGLGQADKSVAQADATYVAAGQDLMIRVSERYFDMLSAFDDLELARSEKIATARQLEQAKQRFEVGLIAITDVHEAQASYDLTIAQEISADNALNNAREALQEFTGEYYRDINRLAKDAPLVEPVPANIQDWVTQAGEFNLTLKASRFATQVANDEISIQRSGHLPTLDIVASRSNSNSSSFTGSTNDTDAISLQLNVPIFAGGAVNSRTRQARHRFNEAQYNQDRTKRSVLRQTRNNYLGVISGISRVKAFEQAVISSNKALEATQAGFEVGTRTIVDVLNSQRDLLRAKQSLYSARYDYILSGLRLKQAAGGLSANDIEGVNTYLKPVSEQ